MTDGTRIEADVLIAADGVRSAIRQAHFRPEAPKHSGCMAWRGLTPKDAVQGLEFERNSYIWMGPERSVVIYYVAGGELLNWIAMGPSDGQTRESWTIRGTVEAALAEFEGWHPRVRSSLNEAHRRSNGRYLIVNHYRAGFMDESHSSVMLPTLCCRTTLKAAHKALKTLGC